MFSNQHGGRQGSVKSLLIAAGCRLRVSLCPWRAAVGRLRGLENNLKTCGITRDTVRPARGAKLLRA